MTIKLHNYQSPGELNHCIHNLCARFTMVNFTRVMLKIITFLGSPVSVNHYYLANLQTLISNRDYRDMSLLVDISFDSFIFFKGEINVPCTKDTTILTTKA